MDIADAVAAMPSVLLPRFLIVYFAVWQAVAIGCPQRPLKFIEYEDTTDSFMVHNYKVNKHRNYTNKDPTPPNRRNFWAQLVMTNRCDTFCALLENLVRRQLKFYLDPGIKVRWWKCIAKPLSCLADVDNDRRWPTHSVLEITLSDDTVWIFDGTIAQYGRDDGKHWLMSKKDYEASCVKPREPSWYQTKNDTYKVLCMVVRDNNEDRYWPQIAILMEYFLDEFDWTTREALSVRGISDLVFEQAMKAFDDCAW